MALILGSVLLFGFIVRGAGLAVAVPLLVIISACASIHFRWGIDDRVGRGSAVFCILVFVTGLGVPLPILGPWLGG
ncbi:MAG: hypothetical protein GEU77_07690 [Deltaproteobacteria bacterium]|nr:hypothetical protein [Deltaproteobacteria bacterium]